MKKALSLFLAMMMVFALSTNAFAATTDIVGTVNGSTSNPHVGDFTDGVAADSFSSLSSPETTIAISAIAGQVNHRYAVDITYDTMEFSITGSTLVWDVNQLKYVNKDTAVPAKNTGFNLKITNYSDLPVNMTANLTTGNMSGANGCYTSDKLAIDVYKGAYTTVDGAAVVPTDGKITDTATKIDEAKIGVVSEFPFSLVISAADEAAWTAVANDYVNYFNNNSGATKVDIAKLTVKIEKFS